MITIQNELWDRIHVFFSEEEKHKIRLATVGQSVSPPAMSVDESMLPAEVVEKLRFYA